MRTIGRDRLWMLGGLVMALVLLAVAWFFFISKQNDETNSVKDSTVSAQDEQTAAQRQLNRVKADSVNLQKYKDALAAAQLALPNDPGLPEFVRELHTSADATGIGVISVRVDQPIAQTSVAAAAPTPTSSGSSSSSNTTGTGTSTGAASIYTMQIHIVASGPTAALAGFLKQIQQIQPRAVLLTQVNEAPGSGAGKTQITIDMTAFIAPGDGVTPTIAPTGTATTVS